MGKKKGKLKNLEYNQYLLAIDARDKLNENYHRWMTFYYVALGSILVTIITLITSEKKLDFTALKLGLSVLATIISLVWHLSCKGYNYWSNNWMHIIKRLELSVIDMERKLAVYTDFSVTVIKSEKKSLLPLKSGNISTPKLTLIVSFFSTLLWASLACYEYFHYEKSICYRTYGIVIGIIILVTCYIIPLKMKYFESRSRNFKPSNSEEFIQN